MENTIVIVSTYVTSFRDNHANTAHIDERVKGNRITEAHSRTGAHLGREENTSLCSPDALQIDLVKAMEVLMACCLFSIESLETARFAAVRLIIWEQAQNSGDSTNEDNESNHRILLS